jgi:hypothetical protein
MVTRLTRSHRLLEVLDGLLLAGIVGTLLMVQPTKLLKHFGVIWITFQDAAVGALGCFKLQNYVSGV